MTSARFSRGTEATMLRLTPRRRVALSETLREFANQAAAALGLGQFVVVTPRSWLAFVGALLWFGFVAMAPLVEGDE